MSSFTAGFVENSPSVGINLVQIISHSVGSH